MNEDCSENLLNNGHRFDELCNELQGCEWDAILLNETWRQEKRCGGRTVVTYTRALVASIKNTESEYS